MGALAAEHPSLKMLASREEEQRNVAFQRLARLLEGPSTPPSASSPAAPAIDHDAARDVPSRSGVRTVMRRSASMRVEASSPTACAPPPVEPCASDETKGEVAVDVAWEMDANEAEVTPARRRHPLRALASYAAFSLLLVLLGAVAGLAVGFVGSKWISPPRALTSLFVDAH